MKLLDMVMNPGAKVQLVRPVAVFALGKFPEGAGGVVERAWVDRGHWVVSIKMDRHFPFLDTWNNCLYVDDGFAHEVTNVDFELVED